MERSADSTGDVRIEAPGELSRGDHLRVGAVAWLVRIVIGLIGATWRIEITAGASHLDELLATRQPTVIGFWHDRLPVLAYFVQRRMLRRGYRVVSFVSRSRDGEIGAKLSKMWGADTVRGSASSGGTSGLRGMYRAVVKDGSSPVIALDGPTGPRHRAKRGAIALARICRIRVLPMASATDRFWQLRSWDRMTVPKPFARVKVTIGEPIPAPETDSSEKQDEACSRLERILHELQVSAESELGVRR
jgi:lysophospholipid acyltransferase (LPLAT)-like uncharacterized protein